MVTAIVNSRQCDAFSTKIPSLWLDLCATVVTLGYGVRLPCAGTTERRGVLPCGGWRPRTNGGKPLTETGSSDACATSKIRIMALP